MSHMNSETVETPWTPAQLGRLIRWQTTPWVHPLTCRESGHGALAVTIEGLVCSWCDYRQTWAPRIILEDDPPPDPRTLFNG